MNKRHGIAAEASPEESPELLTKSLQSNGQRVT